MEGRDEGMPNFHPKTLPQPDSINGIARIPLLYAESNLIQSSCPKSNAETRMKPTADSTLRAIREIRGQSY